MAKHRLPPGDDGHTIVSMNIPGASWSRQRESPPSPDAVKPSETHLTRSETRWLMWGSIKAVLLVGAVFSLALAGFALLVSLM